MSPLKDEHLFGLSDSSCVTIERQLGSGSAGEVLEVKWLGLPVAVKLLHKLEDILDPSSRIQAISDFENERKVNVAIQSHPNIVSFVGTCSLEGSDCPTGAPDYGLVFERVAGNKLDVKQYGIRSRYVETIEVALCVARALAHAHKRGVMHRDVKPSNVLAYGPSAAKLCDWGLAVTLDEESKSSDTGTNEFMAPEVHRGSKYDEKADTFSFAILLYCLCTGSRHAYESTYLTPEQIVDAVSARDLRPNVNTALFREESELVGLMQEAWSPNPRERPSMETISKRLLRVLSRKHEVLESGDPSARATGWGGWFGF